MKIALAGLLLVSLGIKAQNVITYKGENINELDADHNKTGLWKLYAESKNVVISGEMKDGAFISPIHYHKDSRLIATQTTDDVIHIYKDLDTIHARFQRREDNSTTMVDLNGKQLTRDEMIFFTQAGEAMAMYYGGQSALNAFISEHIDLKNTKKNKGKVIVKFTVNGDGELEQIETSGSDNQILIDEAIRVIKLVPRWQPGFQRGRFVRVSFSIPLVFP